MKKLFILSSILYVTCVFAAPPNEKIQEVEKNVRQAFAADYSKLNRKTLYKTAGILDKKKDRGWDAGENSKTKSFYLLVPHSGECDDAIDKIFKINSVSDAKCGEGQIRIDFDQ